MIMRKTIVASLLAAIALSGQAYAAEAEPARHHSTRTDSASGTTRAGQRQIAIVIDDFGNGMKGTKEMLELPVKLTVAVMPFMPTTRQDAEAAYAKGHDVIVHLPMEPISGKKSWLGPGAILTSLPDAEIRRRVESAIRDVPHAVGMNNHMGSRATADARVMRIVLEVCKEHGLFFLDSRTSFRTVVPKVAKEIGVPVVGNDVFLDDVYTSRHVSRQLRAIQTFMKRHETCVAIGHVGPPGLITSGALRSAIPELNANAAIVKVSDLIPSPIRGYGPMVR